MTLRAASPLAVRGMYGLGDNLHQRAIVRVLASTREVYLQTPWPALYHDLPVQLVMPQPTVLRTQAENMRRQRGAYRHGSAPVGSAALRIWYTHDEIRARGGFMAAMAAHAGVPDALDFRLPVPQAWRDQAQVWLDRWAPARAGRPLMLYRPLVERTEWNGCAARNPEPAAYAALAIAARQRGDFFTVSVADTVPGVEWIASPGIGADVECHAGELPVPVLAALMAQAGLVFAAPGFALVMAQAVEAPLVAVFGGHESGRLYRCAWARQLLIEPIHPCECFSKTHPCNKAIDLSQATAALEDFIDAHAAHRHAGIAGRHPPQLVAPAHAVHQSG